jgi:carboxyl-terminal processing protease
LQPGDNITHIIRDTDFDGKKLREPIETDTRFVPLIELEDMLRGKHLTPITLRLYVPATGRTCEVTMRRAPVQKETIRSYLIDSKHRIGYIRLTSFSDNSTELVNKAMADLTEQGVKGLILDLRFNPGGLLTSAIEISDLFIDDGLIVSIKPRTRREQKFSGKKEGSLLDFPMVCLVNGDSSSASEIVAAALQDHKRAFIIGERTHGKGSVQNIARFGDGEIILTTAVFLRPSGKCINRFVEGGDDWGIKPNLNVPLTDLERRSLKEHLTDQAVGLVVTRREFRDCQLEAALAQLRESLKR